jgi:hypothetical protein
VIWTPVLYLIEGAVIALLIIGLIRSHRELMADVHEILRDEFEFPRLEALRERLSAFVRGGNRVGPPDLRRGLRRFSRLWRGESDPEVSVCVVCRETVGAHRRESRILGGLVDWECIPAIVRRRGPAAVVRWLHSGELQRGNHVETERGERGS